jgi:hypothetical protein
MLTPDEELENVNIPEEEEEDAIKRDKIFQNTYDETEIDTSDFTFKVDPAFQEKTYEYTLDEKLILVKVEELLKNETRFDKFQKADENGNFKKMNKSDINDVYSYVTSNLPTDPRIEIFSIISSTFDVNADKFYESLSNSFKTELITELKSRGYLKKRNTLF